MTSTPLSPLIDALAWFAIPPPFVSAIPKPDALPPPMTPVFDTLPGTPLASFTPPWAPKIDPALATVQPMPAPAP